MMTKSAFFLPPNIRRADSNNIPAYNDCSCVFLLNSNNASTNIASTDSTASKHKEKH
jgi:hypothetical protein